MSDDASDPARYFGREVRRARLAAGMTLADFGRVVGYHASQVSRVERGVRAPTEKFAQRCDRAFPGRGGWFHGFYQESRQWSATPPWFRNWIETRAARGQPADLAAVVAVRAAANRGVRARASCGPSPAPRPSRSHERLAARMARQAILTRETPAAPMVWFLVDEAALRRCTGSALIMADQLDHLLTRGGAAERHDPGRAQRRARRAHRGVRDRRKGERSGSVY